ncbi:MAG: contractile injection system tape measure protein, partial [Chitinophagaceae bacterium]|nr:contractile injection system tape measure protein [Chitinophagaceae bacterium]
MNEYAHKIRTVLFDAQVPDEETAGQWTSAVRNLDIDRFMDKTLKPFQENGQRWVIDRMEIDLGWIDIEQTDWIDRLKESIQEELNHQQVSQPLANFSRRGDLITSARENGKLDQKLDRTIYWDLIRECLIKGVLPWQGDINLPLTEWLWKEWKEHKLDTLARLQEVVAKNPQALARLLSWIRQTDPEIQESLLTEDPVERSLYRQFFQWIILVNPIWRQSAFRLDFFTQVWKTLLMYPLSKEERWVKLLDWVSEKTYSNRVENPPSPGRLNSEFSASIPAAYSFIRDWQVRFLERWSSENLIPEQYAHAVKDLPDAKKSQRDVLTAQEEVLEKETLFISNAGIVL